MNWKDRSSSLVKAFEASQITFSTAVCLSGVPSVMTTTMAFFALEFLFHGFGQCRRQVGAAARLVLGEQLVHFVSRHAVEDLGVAVEFDEGDTSSDGSKSRWEEAQESRKASPATRSARDGRIRHRTGLVDQQDVIELLRVGVRQFGRFGQLLSVCL